MELRTDLGLYEALAATPRDCSFLLQSEGRIEGAGTKTQAWG